ncbi:CPBP family intramembrane metalloprotease [Clostridium lacusfryxellense]|nr:CPBP family intramembrane metalloprotease [Clostridium lacusfryxellense]
MFGLFHYPVGHNILQVLMTTVIGFIFAVLRLKFKDCTTLSVGIAHGLYDTFILILSCVLNLVYLQMRKEKRMFER